MRNNDDYLAFSALYQCALNISVHEAGSILCNKFITALTLCSFFGTTSGLVRFVSVLTALISSVLAFNVGSLSRWLQKQEHKHDAWAKLNHELVSCRRNWYYINTKAGKLKRVWQKVSWSILELVYTWGSTTHPSNTTDWVIHQNYEALDASKFNTLTILNDPTTIVHESLWVHSPTRDLILLWLKVDERTIFQRNLIYHWLSIQQVGPCVTLRVGRRATSNRVQVWGGWHRGNSSSIVEMNHSFVSLTKIIK